MAAHEFNQTFNLGKAQVGKGQPTYFIADIAASHDGSLSRAVELIHLCAEAGANAAKFQHFSAETIVSDAGFKALGTQQSHQASWKSSVYEVYQAASINGDWTRQLKAACEQANIDFFTSPYSFEWVDAVDPFVPAYKIGSGDITWHDIIRHIGQKQKPVLLATGASCLAEVQQAMEVIAESVADVVLMQCNTNYTASLDNFNYIHLNVLKTYHSMYPEVVLGLSDHTPGHATVLGAIALGAKVIEKHFTDDNDREGPDHAFSMNPVSWREMVDRARELELALGAGLKQVEENERDTVVLQRRALRFATACEAGQVVSRQDLVPLRPCPADACLPADIEQVVGRKLLRAVAEGEAVTWLDLT